MIHKIPEEWRHMERKLNAEIADKFHVFITNHFEYVRAELAIKGGWKKGYTWGGKFKILLKAASYGRTVGYKTIRIGYTTGGIEEIRRLLDKGVTKTEAASRKNRLVMYHREMLNDKRVSRRHMKLIKARYPEKWFENLDAIKYAESLLFRLLDRRGWELGIDGYHAPDGRVFDDLFTYRWFD